MNFAIEASGSASPLSLQELCRTLQLAISHDASQRQSAGQQLSAWEAVGGDYYPALQSVLLNRELPHEMRFLAITQLKNGIDRHWRTSTSSGSGRGNQPIPTTQKELIRSRLFEGTVGEEDGKLALHNALVTAKIVRIDYPQNWPDALPSLVQLLRDVQAQRNGGNLFGALLIVLRTVKELGTARLRKSQTALASITPELVYILGQVYEENVGQWTTALTTGQGDMTQLDLAMRNSLTALKTLRRLMVTGYEEPHKDRTLQSLWGLFQTHLGQFLNLVTNYDSSSQIPATYLDGVAKHLMQFTKLHLDMSDDQPASFAALPNSFDLVRLYWDLVVKFAQVYDKSGGLRQGDSSGAGGAETKSKVEGPLLEKLALKGLLLVRSCVRMVNAPQQTFKYRTKERRQEQDEIIQCVKAQLLKDELIIQMANVIISNLLVFRKADLEAWEEEPEEWEQQEETNGSAWEWEVRPCAENLMHQLLVSYKHLLLQPLLSYFETVKNPQAELMTKESVYTAIGLAANHVHEHFDFKGLLKTTIVADAQLSGPLCKVLRRRIGILLSQWVPVGIGKENRDLIYEIYRHFLNPDDANNDAVVRITAARQFKWIAEDFSFQGESFRPYAKGILAQLIQLMQQVDVDETKLAILTTTKSIIEHMESQINSFADLIIDSLPAIWASAGDLGLMLKQAVLTILQSLVLSMRHDSVRYQPIIIPLISDAVHAHSDLSIYLIDEALGLWSNILSQTPPPLSPQLLSLAEPAVSMLDQHTENHGWNMGIVTSYIMLSPETMLEDRLRLPTIKALAVTYTSKNRDLQSIATRSLEALIRLAHQIAGVEGLRLLVSDLVASGLLNTIFDAIRDAYDAHLTTGPKRRTPKTSSLLLGDYFVLLSRVAVLEPQLFADLLMPLEQSWPWLAKEWFARFDAMAEDTRRKLNMLALTRLLELPVLQDYVLSCLQDYFAMWSSVISSLLDEETGTTDETVLTEPLEGTEWDSAKDVRERALMEADLVRRVHALEFVKERLGGLVERLGGEAAFGEWVGNVDKDVLAAWGRLGTGTGAGGGGLG